jgi:leucyl-tRNA synthetase
MVAIKSNNNVVYRCAYHVVWCPKYRRPVITGQVDDRSKGPFDGRPFGTSGVLPPHG